jgi:alkylation response protein AidB-like acyl-CoA dehydrogenase
MNWLNLAESLGGQFAAKEVEADENDQFVAENIAQLKASGLVAAGVPAELGGGGASFSDLCAVLRSLGRHCGSTALAFSMHTHQVMLPLALAQSAGSRGWISQTSGSRESSTAQ